MLRRRGFNALVCAGLLSACGEGGDATGALAATPDFVASAKALRPGLYHIVQTGDAAGEDERCIEAAEVAAGRFAMSDSMGEGWVFETNRLSGGTITVEARHDDGRLSMAGAYEPESFVVDAAVDVEVNGQIISNRSALKGTFISPECPETD